MGTRWISSSPKPRGPSGCRHGFFGRLSFSDALRVAGRSLLERPIWNEFVSMGSLSGPMVHALESFKPCIRTHPFFRNNRVFEIVRNRAHGGGSRPYSI